MKIIGNAKTFDMLPQFFDIDVDDRKIIVKKSNCGSSVEIRL